MEEIKRGRGRPPKENARGKIHTLRFDDDEDKMLTYLCESRQQNVSDVIRTALRGLYAHDMEVVEHEQNG